MKLVVGLGNIGNEYARTRHNIGFMVIDEVARALEVKWRTEKKLKADITESNIDGEKILLLKPLTMMNNSGDAVSRAIQFYQIPPQSVWVIYDDVDVPFGKMRIRVGGSSGQQGVRSITDAVGTNFIRLRMGISLNDRLREPSEVYVLKPFNEQEREVLDGIISKAAEAIISRIPCVQPVEETIILM